MLRRTVTEDTGILRRTRVVQESDWRHSDPRKHGVLSYPKWVGNLMQQWHSSGGDPGKQ